MDSHGDDLPHAKTACHVRGFSAALRDWGQRVIEQQRKAADATPLKRPRQANGFGKERDNQSRPAIRGGDGMTKRGEGGIMFRGWVESPSCAMAWMAGLLTWESGRPARKAALARGIPSP